jgi:hypothetical protein
MDDFQVKVLCIVLGQFALDGRFITRQDDRIAAFSR